MSGFRRAQLRGSDELFRSTAAPVQGELPTSDAPVRAAPLEAPGRPSAPIPAPAVMRRPTVVEERLASPEGHLVRLSASEIQRIADALQRQKYPQKLGSRPPVDEYEMLEELRQKLLSTIED